MNSRNFHSAPAQFASVALASPTIALNLAVAAMHASASLDKHFGESPTMRQLNHPDGTDMPHLVIAGMHQPDRERVLFAMSHTGAMTLFRSDDPGRDDTPMSLTDLHLFDPAGAPMLLSDPLDDPRATMTSFAGRLNDPGLEATSVNLGSTRHDSGHIATTTSPGGRHKDPSHGMMIGDRRRHDQQNDQCGRNDTDDGGRIAMICIGAWQHDTHRPDARLLN